MFPEGVGHSEEKHYQFSLYQSAGLMEGWTDEEFAEATIADCYIQAKSTQNVRIERIWRGQRDTTTGTWLRYFRRLELAGHFHDHLLCDKTVICFIFMPIIRQQLAAFVDTHNANPIRKQKQGSYIFPEYLTSSMRTTLYELDTCYVSVDRLVESTSCKLRH